MEIEIPMYRPVNHIVLYSGGVDSFITLRYVFQKMREKIDTVTPVYFRLGHKYQKQEEEAVRKTVGDANIDDTLSGLGLIETEDAHIDSRNAHLVLASLKYIRPYDRDVIIWLTVQEDELEIPDRSMKFFEKMTALCRVLVWQNIQVVTPWEHSDKADMVRWYLGTANREDDLLSTWACYWGNGDVQCGSCPACIRRYIAFRLNSISEEYRMDPPKSNCADRYREGAKNGSYSEKRSKRILEALDGK